MRDFRSKSRQEDIKTSAARQGEDARKTAHIGQKDTHHSLEKQGSMSLRRSGNRGASSTKGAGSPMFQRLSDERED
jgi:hypothetical protein